MIKVYRDADINLSVLKDKTIAIIGYGSQGRAQALNMRDSGLNVIIGAREGGFSWKKASEEAFEVYVISEAAKMGDVVHLLIPDQMQPEVYDTEMHENLRRGCTLSFSHAFNIHFGQIVPPDYVDVIMIAPKGPGVTVREAYTRGSGVPGLFAVAQDYTGRAKETALALGGAVGLSRVGMIETTFREEVETDLFGEQAVLCGGVSELIKAGFETLVEVGYQPEVAYYECLNELKLIVDLIWSKGLEGMWCSVSNTAEYGGRTKGKMIVTEETKKTMKRMLEDIQTGRFAREWIMEYKSNCAVLKTLRKRDGDHLIEKVGKRLREVACPEKVSRDQQ